MKRPLTDSNYTKYARRYNAVPEGGLERIYKNPSSRKIYAYNAIKNRPDVKGLKVLSGNCHRFTVAYILVSRSGNPKMFVVDTGVNEYFYNLI